MAKIGRNEPCPCGSGKKYKRCHLGKPDDPALPPSEQMTEEEIEELAAPPAWKRWVPISVAVIGAIATVYFGVTQGAQQGLAAFAGTGLVLVGWVVLGDPPPPKDDTQDPASINFGN